ncbi:protein kinase domain-containing protein [Geomonas subterranea]|uniref:protein kinase domain-containing protein n=1 Tax=Geomonas subterranea TaxID=2847989 RepID=UPI001CD66894|nr:protein kinase [Geomonas fuzhouensis]
MEVSEEKTAGNVADLWQELTARSAEGVDVGLFRQVADDTFEYLDRGGVGCFRFAEGTMVPQGEGLISLGGDDVVLAATESVDASLLAQDVEGVVRAQTTTQFMALGDAAAQGRGWAMLVFPFERRSSFIDPSWPYNPFVGYQEDRDHEKRGLADIASALFRDPEFQGFRIVGGQHLSMGNTSRMVDGFLVSRWGIYPLELKDYSGQGEFFTHSKNAAFRLTFDGRDSVIKEQPVVKLEDLLRRAFSKVDLGARVITEFRKTALLVFTHPKLDLSCVNGAGEREKIPCQAGNVLICNPATVAQSIRKHVCALFNVTSPGRRLLPQETVDAIVAHLGRPGETAAACDAPQNPLQIGRFLISQVPNESESTSLYQVFDGVFAGREKRVWAKRFDLTTMGRGEVLEREAERLGREDAALQLLEDGVQRCHHSETFGLHHYVIVEHVPGATVDAWLEKQTLSREEKLSMLVRLAGILAHLADEGVVHRAVNPSNIRIDDNGSVKLINFELCQIPTLLTVVPQGREIMDRSYQPREALTPGSSVSAGTDTYSFGKICCKVLAGELPFDFYHEVQKTRKPGFWERFGERCGLSPAQSKDLQKMMSNEQAARPVGKELVSIVKGWC